MDLALDLDRIDKGRESPPGWWRYEILLDGVVVPQAVRAVAGPAQRVCYWQAPDRKGHAGEHPRPPGAEEGAADGHLVWTPPGQVAIRLRAAFRCPVKAGGRELPDVTGA